MAISRSAAARTAALSALALVALSGCSQEAPQPADPVPSASSSTSTQNESAMNAGTLIDVRTAEEFAAGHLEGAVNIDVTSPSFDDEIAKLDKNATYTLYCRSGRRAGGALEAMKAVGIARVTNAGGYEEASVSLGVPIVK